MAEHTLRRALAAPSCLIIALGAGCSFDFSDYDFEAELDAGGDGDATEPDAGRSSRFIDSCDLDAQPLEASSQDFDLDTLRFDNDWEAERCTTPAMGADGFFPVSLLAGEKWHFHLKALEDGVDPILYIVDACDERRCVRAQASNNCASKVEHMSFVPDRDGTYMVGIDTAGSGGAALNFLAVMPECGSGGNPEHSEGCDDGNREDGDGCDHLCRMELGPGDEEGEPNDDFTSANVLFFEDDRSDIRGTISGACDLEKFAIEIPQDGQGITAELLVGPNGDPCTAETAPADLQLQLFDGKSLVGEGTPVDGGSSCPVIDERFDFANDLARGTYHLNFITPDSSEDFPYVLRVTLR